MLVHEYSKGRVVQTADSLYVIVASSPGSLSPFLKLTCVGEMYAED